MKSVFSCVQLPLGFMWNMAHGIVERSAALINVVNLSCMIRISSVWAMLKKLKLGLGSGKEKLMRGEMS